MNECKYFLLFFFLHLIYQQLSPNTADNLTTVFYIKGRLPSKQVLAKYNVTQFSSVADAVRQGNLLKLTEALRSNEKFFIKAGVYLILEKLKIITYRNLFKKVLVFTLSCLIGGLIFCYCIS